MRVFEMTYKKNGETRVARNWWVAFRDHNHILRRLPAFRERGASESFGHKIEQLSSILAAGERPDVQLLRWVESLPESRRKRLSQWGLIGPGALAAGRPLAEHFSDYYQALLDDERTRHHAAETKRRCERIINGIGAVFIKDVTADAVRRYLADRRRAGLAIKTSNHYLAAMKAFCGWMHRRGLLTDDPVKALSKLNEKTDPRRKRRALEPEEFQRLITTTAEAPKRFKLTGPQRALLYRLAAETGLRAGELRSLTPGSFELGADPCVTVEAAHAKNRKAATIALRAELAADLAEHLAGKLPNARAFSMAGPDYMAKMLRADVEAAGIPYVDDAGRVFDFHALRHHFGTMLARAGVHPKTAQDMMRHSTIGLTLDLYTHTAREDIRAALRRLGGARQPLAVQK